MFDLAQLIEGTAGEGLSDQQLEDEICAHGARLVAGECQLVMLVAEMDRRGTWFSGGRHGRVMLRDYVARPWSF